MRNREHPSGDTTGAGDKSAGREAVGRLRLSGVPQARETEATTLSATCGPGPIEAAFPRLAGQDPEIVCVRRRCQEHDGLVVVPHEATEQPGNNSSKKCCVTSLDAFFRSTAAFRSAWDRCAYRSDMTHRRMAKQFAHGVDISPGPQPPAGERMPQIVDMQILDAGSLAMRCDPEPPE